MANGGLKYQFASFNIAEKLIALNVAVFLIDKLLASLASFELSNRFQLPKEFFDFIYQPWSLITYSFFHGDIWHILTNMFILFFSGRIFLNLFNNERFIAVYFLGVIFGGLLFLMGFNLLPNLVVSNTPGLIGASAGVLAILIFICSYIPSQEVRIFSFNIKLWYIGAALVLKDIMLIPYGENTGGRIAHLGGAALGYLYARQLLKGNDIGAGFTKFLDSLSNLFKPGEKKAPLKTVYKNKSANSQSKVDYDKQARQRKIDDILDKISKSGYESLSKTEKDFLFKAGKEN